MGKFLTKVTILTSWNRVMPSMDTACLIGYGIQSITLCMEYESSTLSKTCCEYGPLPTWPMSCFRSIKIFQNIDEGGRSSLSIMPLFLEAK